MRPIPGMKILHRTIFHLRPSSEDEFLDPSPSQYKVERSKKQLEQRQSSEEESDDEEGESNFNHFWENQILKFWCDLSQWMAKQRCR
jgi:hypothetical protein